MASVESFRFSSARLAAHPRNQLGGGSVVDGGNSKREEDEERRKEKEEGEKVVGSSTEEEIFGHGIRFVARDELYPAIDKDVAAGRGGIAMI